MSLVDTEFLYYEITLVLGKKKKQQQLLNLYLKMMNFVVCELWLKRNNVP